MARQYHQKEEGKWNIWSTITDSYILSRDVSQQELIGFIILEKFSDFQKDVVEFAMTFPEGRAVGDMKVAPSSEKTDRYWKYVKEDCGYNPSSSIAADKKFKEIITEFHPDLDFDKVIAKKQLFNGE